MKTTKTVVKNTLGLHARPAAMLAARAASYHASISLENGIRTADAKSIMALMLLAAPMGSVLEIQARGDDEEEAVADIAAMFEDAFGELDEP